MIERVHQHLLSELERTTRADTVFVVCAVVFNILALFISWAQVPADGTYPSGSLGIYMLTILGIIVISGAALRALQNGRRSCEGLTRP
jgi:TRAP-type C4-dicarboxylate transport system permease small subunit